MVLEHVNFILKDLTINIQIKIKIDTLWNSLTFQQD